MELFEVIAKRRSVRRFKDKPISEEQLGKLLEAINSAPSAHNAQAYELVLVESPDKKKELAKAALDQDFIEEAPMNIVFCANPLRVRGKDLERAVDYAKTDASIACAYAQLAAVDLGLSSVWVGAFYRDEVSMILDLPKDWEPVAILPIGYADENPPKRPRRPLDDLVKRRI
ncbi:MAG: nitroreductase family protein [Candidatus Diapherotrites archaeon]|nr:nitroreductase family protein [Candidatus Diapherotrites archaeon]